MKLQILALTILCGCGGINYAMQNYSGVDVQTFGFAGTVYRVFDKPEEGRLMITPTLGNAAAAGVIQGGTLGLSGDPLSPQGQFRQASDAFIKQRNQKCRVTDGAKVIHPQYEFFYTCT